MSTQVGQVNVKLGLDKSQYERGIAEAQSSIKGLSNVFASLAGIGVGATLAAIGQNALKASADYEQAQVSFEVMLGSAERATKLISDIQQMANVTPFETQDLTDSAKVLLNFGESLNDIIPELKMLGDVSGGNAEKMKSLTLVFGQMSANGRLMGQDLLQMINAGFNPLQEISKRTGKSISELRDEMEKGKISASMVKQAFIDVTSEGGRFYNMMGKQSKTLSGEWSTLQDAVTQISRTIGNELAPSAKNAVENFTDLANKTNDNIVAFKEWADTNQVALKGVQDFAMVLGFLAVSIPTTIALINTMKEAYLSASATIKASNDAILALDLANKAVSESQIALNAATIEAENAERGLYAARLLNDEAMIAEMVKLRASTTNKVAEAEATIVAKNAKVAEAEATIVSTRLTSAQYLATGNLSKAVSTAATEVKALTVALLTNPWTWVAAGAVAASAAIFAMYENTKKAERAISDLNNKTDQLVSKTSSNISTIKELVNVENLDLDQKRRLQKAIGDFTTQFPKYAAKLVEELKYKKEISKATAEEIANEITLNKVKQLNKQKEAELYSVNNTGAVNYAPVPTTMNAPDTHMIMEARRNAVRQRFDRQIEQAKKDQQNIVNSLLKSNAKISVGGGNQDSTKPDKNKKDKQGDTPYEKQKKLYDRYLAQQEAKGIEMSNNDKLAAYNTYLVKVSKKYEEETDFLKGQTALREAKDKDVLNAKLANYDKQLAASKGNAEQEYNIELEKLNSEQKQYKANSAEYIAIDAKKVELKKAYTDKQRDIESQALIDSLNLQKQDLDNKINNLNLEVEQHKITKDKMLEQEAQFINEKLKLENQTNEKLKAIYEGDKAALYNIDSDHNRNVQQLNQQKTENDAKTWENTKQFYLTFEDSITSSWSRTVGNLIRGDLEFADFTKTIGNGVLDAFGDVAEEMTAKWIKETLIRDTITQSSGLKEIAVNSYSAIVNAIKSVVGIPVVGPALAVGAAAGTAALIASYAHREKGGDVESGKPYIVGEKGQELFIPNTSGTIVSNKDLNSMNSQPITVIVQNSVNATDAKSFEGRLDEFSKKIGSIASKEIAKNQRNWR